jgi:hypothetical protein
MGNSPLELDFTVSTGITPAGARIVFAQTFYLLSDGFISAAVTDDYGTGTNVGSGHFTVTWSNAGLAALNALQLPGSLPIRHARCDFTPGFLSRTFQVTGFALQYIGPPPM